MALKNNETICHQYVLIRGSITCPVKQPSYPNDIDPTKGRFIRVNSDVIASNSLNSWPVSSLNEFKVTAFLKKGKNNLVLNYNYKGLETGTVSLTLNYVENMNLQPLNLGILLAKDSKKVFDMDTASKAKGEKNDLNSAIKRVRTAALLWQALTSDSLNSNGFGRLSFRLDLDSNNGLLKKYSLVSYVVFYFKISKIAPIVNIFTSSLTVNEMLSKTAGTNNDPLFGIANDAILASTFYTSKPAVIAKNSVVACLLLDSFYDKNQKKVFLHTALGSGYTNPRIGIFGSHLTHAWPEDETQLISRFLDSTPLDFNQLADDSSPNKYEALNTGIGAFLHEAGHAHTLGGH